MTITLPLSSAPLSSAPPLAAPPLAAPPLAARPLAALPPAPTADDRLRAVAQKLEASFLSEMLKSAGLDSAAGAFGGGIGEDQFQSYLRQAQATEMARAGGVGLAESIFHALKARGA